MMRNFLDTTFLLALLFSICFLITAGILYFFPSKKVNHFYGYRTIESVKSQERWDFSQHFFAIQMSKAAIVILGLSFTGLLIPGSGKIRLWISVIIIVLAISYMYATTEAELKKRFTKLNS